VRPLQQQQHADDGGAEGRRAQRVDEDVVQAFNSSGVYTSSSSA
jgi:hypothetical protein